MHACCRFSCVQLFATLWTIDCQAPLSLGSSRQEYWSGLPCPSPRDLPDPRFEPMSLRSPALQVSSLPLAPPGKPSFASRPTVQLPRPTIPSWHFLLDILNSTHPKLNLTPRHISTCSLPFEQHCYPPKLGAQESL